MQSIALDVHRDFCEVAIKDGGEVRSRGRIKTSVEELELFAGSLAPDDQVALEASGPALRIARVLEPHVGRVVIANPRKLRAIAEAKVKTDRVDARTLCELLAAGFLPEVHSPDEETRALRRRLARRAALVRQRTRAKNELHAVLARNLKRRPPMSDVFGVCGREWLEALELPTDERETVAGCLRQVDFLDREVDALERGLARSAQIALVATARKLCVLFWHLLTDEEDYAFGRPSLHRHKLRRLELVAGDPSHRGRRSGSAASKREQRHERELSEQFEAAYRRLVDDWQPKRGGAGATRGRAS